MMARGGGGKGKKKGKRSSATKFFDVLAGRPFPQRISLQQGITVQLEIARTTLATTSTTVNVFSGASFALSSCQGYPSYIALFDQYKIDQIEVWIEPVSAEGTVAFGPSYTCIDLDDPNTPTSIANVAAHQDAMIGNGGAGRYLRWKPHMAVAGQTTTNLVNVPGTWIDSGYPGVLHFGLKAAYEATPAGAIVYSFFSRLTVSFRAPGLQ